jgi:hypothetical protein
MAGILFPEGVRDFSLHYSVQTGSGADSSLLSNWYRELLSGEEELSDRDVKLNTHLYALRRSRIRGIILPLPHTSSYRDA